jgi:hypothetical protein
MTYFKFATNLRIKVLKKKKKTPKEIFNNVRLLIDLF